MSFLFLPRFTRPSSLAEPPPPFPFRVRLTYPCLHAFRPGGLGNPTRWRVTSGSGLFLDFLSEPYSRFPLSEAKACAGAVSFWAPETDMHELPARDLSLQKQSRHA